METALSTRQKDPGGPQSKTLGQTVGGAADNAVNQTATSVPNQPEGKKKKKKQEVSAVNAVKVCSLFCAVIFFSLFVNLTNCLGTFTRIISNLSPTPFPAGFFPPYSGN